MGIVSQILNISDKSYEVERIGQGIEVYNEKNIAYFIGNFHG